MRGLIIAGEKLKPREPPYRVSGRSRGKSRLPMSDSMPCPDFRLPSAEHSGKKSAAWPKTSPANPLDDESVSHKYTRQQPSRGAG
jgi:hypothetical protein